MGERQGGTQVTILNKIGISFVEKMTFKQRVEGIGASAYGYLEKRLSKQRGGQSKGPWEQGGGQRSWSRGHDGEKRRR